VVVIFDFGIGFFGWFLVRSIIRSFFLLNIMLV